MDPLETYQTPLSRFVTSDFLAELRSDAQRSHSRYASKEMAYLFSPAVRTSFR